MEDNSDGDEAEQIFYDTVREYVVSISKLKFIWAKDSLNYTTRSNKMAELINNRDARMYR